MGLAGIYDKRSEKALCLLLCPLVFLNRWFKYWCNLLNLQFVIMIIMTVNAGFILLPSKLNKIIFFLAPKIIPPTAIKVSHGWGVNHQG